MLYHYSSLSVIQRIFIQGYLSKGVDSITRAFENDLLWRYANDTPVGAATTIPLNYTPAESFTRMQEIALALVKMLRKRCILLLSSPRTSFVA